MNTTNWMVGLGGTLRENSLSRAALQAALNIAARQGVQTELLDLRALNLPMYVPDWGLSDYPREHQPAIEHFIESCRMSKAMVWASPTYHGTVSGVFKNALDFIEMLSEETPPYLNGKAIGLISINDSKTFSAMSNSVHELQAWLAPTHVVLKKADFDLAGDIHLNSDSGTRRVTRLVNELMHFLR